MDLIFWFLPGILILGILTSYTDIRYGKIRNIHIALALVYSVFVYVFLILTLDSYRVAYLGEWISTAFLSLFIGYIIWHVGLWTAGDAKLFFAYSLLVPLSVYSYGYIPFLSSVNILINTLCPIFIIMSILLLFRTTWKEKLFYLKSAFEPKQIVQLFIFLFALIWVMSLVFSKLNVTLDYFSGIFFIFLIIIILEKLIFGRLFWLIIILSLLRLFFDKSVYSFGTWKFLLLIWLIFIITRFFILSIGYRLLTKKVDIKLLTPGLVPAELIYQEGKTYKKEKILYFSLFSYLYEKTKKKKYLFEPVSEGLTGKEVKKLKSLENKLPFEHLRVHKTLSFAPYMFFGVLLTVLFQGNLFLYLAYLVFQ